MEPIRLRTFAERAALMAMCQATAATLLFVGLNRLTPADGPRTLASVFLEWCLAFYIVVTGGLLLGAWAAARVGARVLPRWRAWHLAPRLALMAAAGAFLAACLLRNRDGIAALFDLPGPLRFRLLSPAAFALAAAGMVACAGVPLGRPRLVRLLALGAPLAAALAFLPERAVERTVENGVAARPVASASRPDRLLLIGIDGGDWHFIDPLAARGELPNIAALRRRGAWGPLETIVPTRSPAIWTTIVTGQPPARHGVEAFTTLRMRGASAVLRRTRKPRGIGFRTLYGLLERWEQIAQGPVPSTARRVPAYWNLATAAGTPVLVVNWWATWPAEAVLGAVVSDRLHFWRQAARGDPPEDSALTYPDALQEDLRSLVMAPADVTWDEARTFMDVSPEEFAAMKARPFKGKTIESEFAYFYSMFETNRKVALHLLRQAPHHYGAPADLLVLFRIVDIASHSSLAASELVPDHLGTPPDDVRRYSRVVSEAYRRVDAAIGEFMAAAPDATVVVVSDHGFQVEGTGPQQPRIYHHMQGPPGMFLAAGPAFRPGRVEGLSVYDVMPVLAAVKGFPIADDLPGRIPAGMFDPVQIDTHALRRVATYGRRRAGPAPAPVAATDEAALERLRALGYVN